MPASAACTPGLFGVKPGASGAADGVPLRRNMRITRPSQDRATSLISKGTACTAFKSACHCATLTCANATALMRAPVLSRVRSMLSKPRQLRSASTAIKASATSTSTSVKPCVAMAAWLGEAFQPGGTAQMRVWPCGWCISIPPLQSRDPQQRRFLVHHLHIDPAKRGIRRGRHRQPRTQSQTGLRAR